MRGFVLRSCPPRPAPTPAGMTRGSSICCCHVLPGISPARPSLLLTPAAPACPSTSQLRVSGRALRCAQILPLQDIPLLVPLPAAPVGRWKRQERALLCFVINKISPWEHCLNRCQQGGRCYLSRCQQAGSRGGRDRDVLPAPGDFHS